MSVIGVGIDVVEIERVDRMIVSRGERLLARLFTPAEVAYCTAKALPARHFAVRLAAKEAAFKALSGSEDARIIGWKELEVGNTIFGSPTIYMHGRAKVRAELLGVTGVHLSLSHSDLTAVAVVILEAT